MQISCIATTSGNQHGGEVTCVALVFHFRHVVITQEIQYNSWTELPQNGDLADQMRAVNSHSTACALREVLNQICIVHGIDM